LRAAHDLVLEDVARPTLAGRDADLAVAILTMTTGLAYVLPNFAVFNVVSEVAHSVPIPGQLILFNSLYALLYATAVTSVAVLIFDRRNLK